MKKLLLIILALSLLLPPGIVHAESKVYVKDTTLNIYSSANTSSKLMGKMGFGVDFTLMATSGSWARVRNSAGAVGYCLVSGLSKNNPNTDMRTVYAASESAKVYTMPSSEATVRGILHQNDSATLLCVSGDNVWCRVRKNGEVAYMKKSDLSLTKTGVANQYTVYVESLYLKAYASASTSSRYLGRLPLGTQLTLVNADGAWAYVKNAAGIMGYCDIDSITAMNPAGNPIKMYALRDGVNAYAGPDTGERTARTFHMNEDCEVVIQKDGWGAVASGNGYIYVRLDDFGENVQESAQTVYISAYELKAYQKPDSSSKLLGMLYFGTSLTLISQDSEWAYVLNQNGAKGYCRVSDLSWTNPNGDEKTYYALKKGAAVYQTPSEKAKKLKTCDANEKITVVAETADGKWMRVRLSNGYGYASWEDFANSENVKIESVYVKDYSAMAYARADSTSKKLGALPFGTEMTYLSETGIWTMVKNSAGNVGYMLTEALTIQNPNTLNETVYARSDGTNIYRGVSESAGLVKTLSLNEAVSVIARTEDEKWLRVIVAGMYGYAQAEEFTAEQTVKETKVHVSAAKLNIYEAPDENSKVVGVVGYASSLTALGDKLPNDWAKVRNEDNGREAYAKTVGLTVANLNNHNKEYYAQTTANGHTLPDTKSAVSVVFPMNEKVKVTAVLSGNAWVRAQSGKIFAYVETKNLGSSMVPEGTAGYTDPYRGTASAKIEKVIALAVQQYGKPYIYATEGPDSYDCSGLTLYCFKQCAGINLHRSAQKQGYDTRYTKITSVEALKRGDIICMNTIADNDLSDHVGIYLGGGKFIHASSGGEKVIVSSITSGFYNRVFSWALRVLP